MKTNTKLPDVHGYCLFLLGLRLRTEGELREKMAQRGYEAAVINAEIAQLKANNYINDGRFAENFTDNLKKYKSYGYYQVKKKLMEKRLSAPLIERTLAVYFTLEDEALVAKRFVKKDPSLSKKGFETRQKLARRLKNRGFRSEIIGKFIT